MTVSADHTYDRWTIDGNGPYNYEFKIFAESDLVVRAIDPDTGTAALLSLGTHYSVSGEGEEDGGTITLLGSTATTYDGYTLDIRSDIPRTQPTSFTNSGRFLPETHEQAFDRLSRQVQDLSRRIDAAVRAPDYESAASMVLPPIADRVGKYLTIDEDGNLQAVEEVTGVGSITYNLSGAALRSSSASDAIHFEETLGLGGRRWRITPRDSAGSNSAELELVPGQANDGSGIMSQIILYGFVGTDYERFAISRVGPEIVIDSTANNSGTARNIVFQMGGKVTPSIAGQNALLLYADASVDLNGAAYTAHAKNWGATRTRIADWADTGDSRLIIDTRTRTPASNTADSSSIEFRRGGVNKWSVGLNVGGAGADSFDFAFGGSQKASLKSDGTLDLVGDLNLGTGQGLRVNNQQVVSDRVTGWEAATGTATRTTFATGSVTTAQLAERVKALIDDLQTHGLIGPTP